MFLIWITFILKFTALPRKLEKNTLLFTITFFHNLENYTQKIDKTISVL